jgi:hypothetical protein
MFESCRMLQSCGFFKKHSEMKTLACKGFIQKYCMGPQKSECKRMEFRKRSGTPPSDDMLPNGHMIAG